MSKHLKQEPPKPFNKIESRCVYCAAPNIETKSEMTTNPVCTKCAEKHGVEIIS